MRDILVIAALLTGCGAADEPAKQVSGAGQPNAASVSAANPLIGVWARISGSQCRVEQVEFTDTRMTAEASPDAPMRTVAARYDLAHPRAPVVIADGAAPLRFRIIDATHIGEGDCVLARAD